MDNFQMYEAQANSVDVDDIAENSNNRIVMRRIKNNNANDENNLYIQNQHDYGCVDYVPEGVDDMGWLGYFVGTNNYLKRLYINSFEPPSGESVRGVTEPFFRGISGNKSIHMINFDDVDLLGGDIFTMLTPFFKNNYNLKYIDCKNCNFGDDGARLFSLAIGSSTHKSLKRVELEDNDISDEGLVEIITALSMYPHLEYLDFDGNRLRKNGCLALATLLQCSATELEHLFISGNDIGDEGIEALVPALTNCNQLTTLNLSDNPSITSKGWQSLASILEAPNSNLKELGIQCNNADDEAAAAFANALANNRTLHTLSMNSNPITAIGWQSFSNLLCNTSSVNSTFLSNHTLRQVGCLNANANEIVRSLLSLNAKGDNKKVAMIKILRSHEDFDMQPFFEWEFKVLPVVLSCLERTSAYEMPRGFEPNIGKRKLSTIYQFVRGMPVLYVETRLRKELEDIKVAESQMEEEELQEEFMQRKQLLQERKENIMRRLGGKLRRE